MTNSDRDQLERFLRWHRWVVFWSGVALFLMVAIGVAL